ncbi:TonB-dependent receptor [Flavobacterium limnophilum]|uniref:TonB-dependent receptor n=1 Tax=Flavobacterium limnophilum TaxID=3003262 RepID=UPI002482D8C2|nr:TonB-dependent receptor [Flavobacterium limnophilum]
MTKYFFILTVLMTIASNSQNTLKAVVKNGNTGELLVGAKAQIRNTDSEKTTDKNGFVALENIPNGKQQIAFSCAGYESKIESLDFPLSINDTLQISLESTEGTELTEVVVQSTRTSRTIKNTPTRIEIMDGEELDEKSNMKVANVSVVLQESTGINVQQTSATSGNASIRMQGLDGRYSQLLKDGYANFGNFASGLSVLEIPPLDLQQIEVIKGPVSTLYGGGAIAGVIDFISKKPKTEGEYDIILNQSNVGQSNIGAYASKRKGKFGYTLMGLANFQQAYDVDKDGFSEIPKGTNFTVNPQLFYYPTENSSLMIGNSFSKGDLRGGDMQVIKGDSDGIHTYFEENNTIRNTTTVEFDKKFENKNSFKLKQSLNLFDRKINIPNYLFSGVNTNTYTDASYVWNKEKFTLLGGINLIYDNFKQKDSALLDSKSFTTGAYIQHTWDVAENIKLESGLRLDNVHYSNPNYSKNQAFVLPRISALFKINRQWSSRVTGGSGYKIPSVFTEQTETMQYQNILALNNVVAEKSIGGTFDVNFNRRITNDLSFSMNHMFFSTKINKPLVLQNNNAGYFFVNADNPVTSNGFESNLKFIYDQDVKLFVGYTFTDVKAKYLEGHQFLPLVPKNKLNLILMYEKEDNFKIGLEGYFTDHQYLYNGYQTPTFWKFGAMAQKTIWENYNFFINFENFTDTRQSNYKRVVNGPANSPTFDEIWTYTEGFVFNFGVKMKF